MKKSGILNARLMEEITALGHFDTFVICDMGFPIPRDAVKIDLTLIKGIPTFMQTLNAVLNEVIVQKVFLIQRIKEANKELDVKICGLLTRQEIEYLNFEDFRTACKDAKFFVRTAEHLPCSNILMVTASGVQERVEQYDINP